jgi:hypothetical protein
MFVRFGANAREYNIFSSMFSVPTVIQLILDELKDLGGDNIYYRTQWFGGTLQDWRQYLRGLFEVLGKRVYVDERLYNRWKYKAIVFYEADEDLTEKLNEALLDKYPAMFQDIPPPMITFGFALPTEHWVNRDFTWGRRKGEPGAISKRSRRSRSGSRHKRSRTNSTKRSLGLIKYKG